MSCCQESNPSRNASVFLVSLPADLILPVERSEFF